MLNIVFVEFVTFTLQLFDGGLHIDRIPNRNGVDDQIQAGCLIQLIFLMTLTDSSLIGDKDIAPEGVQGFAFIQLNRDALLIFRALQIFQDKKSFHSVCRIPESLWLMRSFAVKTVICRSITKRSRSPV